MLQDNKQAEYINNSLQPPILETKRQFEVSEDAFLKILLVI